MQLFKVLDGEQLSAWRIGRLFGQYASMAKYRKLGVEDRAMFECIGDALRDRPWTSRIEFYRHTSMDAFMLRLYEIDILGLPSY